MSFGERLYNLWWDALCERDSDMRVGYVHFRDLDADAVRVWKAAASELIRVALTRMKVDVPPSLDFFEDLPQGLLMTEMAIEKMTEESFDCGHVEGVTDAEEAEEARKTRTDP